MVFTKKEISLDYPNARLSDEYIAEQQRKNQLQSAAMSQFGNQIQPRVLIPKEIAAYSVLMALGFQWKEGHGWVKI